ncbi:MAG: hypothetical protein FWC20_05675 [Oscillospiraceae bacterium]|nr:hypothetical protein [Oscillospiraceae bacterium]MCL2278882.1 hypothetical protein [Oscillospiraceae bacterium]
MWKYIKQIPQKLHTAITLNAKAFIKDERGLSGVVVAILLILVAVLAIVLIWGFLGGWLSELWDDITGNAGQIA